jgi:hypothetical protein
MEAQPRQSQLKTWWSAMPNEQRFAVVILAFCGFGALILSIAQMRSHLISPFMVSNKILAQAEIIYNQQAQAEQEEALKKERDTDRDGLSDYAELNIYKTSPYLPDSDSDGIPDAIEIAQGTSPTCPKGKQCTPLVEALAAGPNTSTQAFNDLLAQESQRSQAELLNSLQPRLPTPEELAAMSATGTAPVKGKLLPPDQMTPQMIRTYMTENKLIAADQLEKLSDAQLIRAYEQAFNYVQDRYQSQ